MLKPFFLLRLSRQAQTMRTGEELKTQSQAMYATVLIQPPLVTLRFTSAALPQNRMLQGIAFWVRGWMLCAASVFLAVSTNSTVPREHEQFYDFLIYITEGNPELRQYLVRKMLLHISTPAWIPPSCPAPNRPIGRRGQQIHQLKVVVLIATPLESFEWRQMVRQTLPELTSKLSNVGKFGHCRPVLYSTGGEALFSASVLRYCS